MEQQSLVKDIIVEIDRHPRKATYFVEADTIHVMIDGRSYMLAAGPDDPEGTVKATLLAHYLKLPRSE